MLGIDGKRPEHQQIRDRDTNLQYASGLLDLFPVVPLGTVGNAGNIS